MDAPTNLIREHEYPRNKRTVDEWRMSNLFDEAAITGPIAFILAVVVETLQPVIDLPAIGEALLQTNGTLVALVVIMLILDTATGAVRALCEGQGFQARQFGRFFAKTATYSVTVMVFVLLANGSMEVPVLHVLFQPLDEFSLFMVALREGSSILENTTGRTLDQAIKYRYTTIQSYLNLAHELKDDDPDE